MQLGRQKMQWGKLCRLDRIGKFFSEHIGSRLQRWRRRGRRRRRLWLSGGVWVSGVGSCLLHEVFYQIAKNQRECAAHQNLTQNFLLFVVYFTNFFLQNGAAINVSHATPCTCIPCMLQVFCMVCLHCMHICTHIVNMTRCSFTIY